jgi:hypothetical protein
MQFGQELLQRAEAADFGPDGYAKGSLVLPPRMVLGPAHTPRAKAAKITTSMLHELSDKVMTSDDVIGVLEAKEAKDKLEAAESEARKKNREADSAMRKVAADSLAAAKAEMLAFEKPLREYAVGHDVEVSNEKRLTLAQLRQILTLLNPDASKTGGRDALVTSCLNELPDVV